MQTLLLLAADGGSIASEGCGFMSFFSWLMNVCLFLGFGVVLWLFFRPKSQDPNSDKK